MQETWSGMQDYMVILCLTFEEPPNCLVEPQTQVPPLGWEDFFEEEMATHSSILA